MQGVPQGAASQEVEVNRQDLSWALQAVLPHAGSKSTVNFEPDWLYASDGYTIGMTPLVGVQGETGPFFMQPRECAELERWVRPRLVGEREQPVLLHLAEDGLHVGRADETAVYDWTEPGPANPQRPAAEVLAFIRRLYANPQTSADDLRVFNPDYAARFAAAKRDKGRDEVPDALVMHARQGIQMGAAVVTVGDNFIGALMGLTYEQAVVSPLLEEVLDLRSEAA